MEIKFELFNMQEASYSPVDCCNHSFVN